MKWYISLLYRSPVLKKCSEQSKKMFSFYEIFMYFKKKQVKWFVMQINFSSFSKHLLNTHHVEDTVRSIRGYKYIIIVFIEGFLCALS